MEWNSLAQNAEWNHTETTHSFALTCAEAVENLTLRSRAVSEGRGLFWLYPTEDVCSFLILENQVH